MKKKKSSWNIRMNLTFIAYVINVRNALLMIPTCVVLNMGEKPISAIIAIKFIFARNA
jgi:hypothetical protein